MGIHLGSLDKLTIDDLKALLQNAVVEDRYIDYKQELVGQAPNLADNVKLDFLADVASFANGAGGDVVFGVEERRDEGRPTGVPVGIRPLRNVNFDVVRRRLQEIADTGLDPKGPGLSWRELKVDGGSVVVMRVPRSWRGPHRIRENGRFYVRGSGANRNLDTGEIRSLLVESTSLGNRARQLRDERLARIYTEDLPLKLGQGAKIVLHLVPAGAFDPDLRVDLTRAENVKPPYMKERAHRYNADGLVVHGPFFPNADQYTSYVQVFRTGAVEAVESLLLEPEPSGKIIRTRSIERLFLDMARDYSRMIVDIGLDAPMVVMASLVDVEGYRLDEDLLKSKRRPPISIDRPIVTLPDILIDWVGADAPKGEQELSRVMRPILDGLWQAGGRRGCPRYLADGTYDKTTQVEEE